MPYYVNVYVSAVCNIVADIILIAFAVPRVCKFSDCFEIPWLKYATVPLNMPRSQKIALLTVVCLGILVIVAAVARCIAVVKLSIDDPLCKFTYFPPLACWRSALMTMLQGMG